MESNGTGLTQITNNDHDDTYFSVSSDGRKIAFQSYPPGSYGIYVMDSDGSNQIDLYVQGGKPSWSPDGSKIVYQTSGSLYVMDSDGSNQIQLTAGNSPSWSPDGSKIVFGGSHHIFVINSDGSNRTQLTNNISGPGSYALEPSWSPDGTKIAFQAEMNSYDGYKIFVMDADGSNQQAITSHGVHEHPSWSPDGSKIVFHASVRANDIYLGLDNEIVMMAADGSTMWQFTENSGQFEHDIYPQWVSGAE